MPVRVFNEDEKIEIKEKLLSVGFPMLKEYGMIHMSIPKISDAAGIGTGTFYRFFKSKEEYIYELILRQRKILMREYIPAEVIAGQRKLSRDEVRRFVELIVDKDKSVYANLGLSDSEKIFLSVENLTPSVTREKEVSAALLNYIDNQRDDMDFPLLANLFKVLAITSQARNELHEEAYAKTINKIIDMIIEELFN